MQAPIENIVLSYIILSIGALVFVLYALLLGREFKNKSNLHSSRLIRYLIGIGMPILSIIIVFTSFFIYPDLIFKHFLTLMLLVVSSIVIIYWLNNRSFFDQESYQMKPPDESTC